MRTDYIKINGDSYYIETLDQLTIKDDYVETHLVPGTTVPAEEKIINQRPLNMERMRELLPHSRFYLITYFPYKPNPQLIKAMNLTQDDLIPRSDVVVTDITDVSENLEAFNDWYWYQCQLFPDSDTPQTLISPHLFSHELPHIIQQGKILMGQII